MKGTGWFTIPLFFINYAVMMVAWWLFTGAFPWKETANTVMAVLSLILAWVELFVIVARTR